MPVVGEGSFGCVHSPSLKCKTKRNINYDNKVSKLLTDKDAKDELKELSLFKEIDKLEEHYLGYPRKCKPMDDEETKQEINKCSDGKKFIEKYKDYFDWNIISQEQLLRLQTIVQFKDKINWMLLELNVMNLDL